VNDTNLETRLRVLQQRQEVRADPLGLSRQVCLESLVLQCHLESQAGRIPGDQLRQGLLVLPGHRARPQVLADRVNLRTNSIK